MRLFVKRGILSKHYCIEERVVQIQFQTGSNSYFSYEYPLRRLLNCMEKDLSICNHWHWHLIYVH